MKQCQRRFVWFPAVFVSAMVFIFPGWNLDCDALARGPKTQLIEPCEIIARAEAEKIMGEEMKDGQYSENRAVGQKICFYEAADDNSFAFLQISLTQNSFISPDVLAAGQNSKTIFTSIKEAFPDRQDITGIGDDAFIATPGIHILKGDYYLTIGAGNLNHSKDKLMDAARKAMANLEATL